MSDRLVSATTTIDAPPAAVFAIVADPRQHPRIDGSGSLRGTITGPERLAAKGDTFGMDMKMFGLPYKIHNKVVEFEADRRIAWRHFGAHRWRYELTPTDDGGTQVTETWDATRYKAPAFAALRALGFPAKNQAGITETLVRLKKAAETDVRTV
ncbi:MAG: SRPBCC family protein [Nocardioidaceae bacterium]